MPPTRKRPVVLVVLDGWGYREARDGNAIAMARTPNWSALWQGHPRTLLEASGLAVGLPERPDGKQRGRPPQPRRRPRGAAGSRAHRHGDRRRHVLPERRADAARARGEGARRHAPPRGAHRQRRRARLRPASLRALRPRRARGDAARSRCTRCSTAATRCPRSALGFMRETVERAKGRAVIASLGGRYFGMDRDKRWPRTEKWYRAMVDGTGPRAADPVAAVQAAYDRGENDEFVTPVVIERDGKPVAPVRAGDGIILLQLPRRPDAADRARAHRAGLRWLRRDGAPGDRPRHDDDVRRDVHACRSPSRPSRSRASSPRW